jgi:DNA-binding PadR family transcriptional regulator
MENNNDRFHHLEDHNHKHHDREHHAQFNEIITEIQKLGGLRMWIMHVLDENGPTNGAEIMEAVQAHTNLSLNGPYKNAGPLPGSIYPMLKKMVSEDIINKNSKGLYNLTENGKKLNSKILGRFQVDNREQDIRKVWSIENILTEIENDLSYLEDIKTEKLSTKKEIIKNLTERINKINESLE